VSPGPFLRRALLAGAVLALLALAWGTLAGALHQLPRCRTFWQGVETAVQLACSLLSLLTLFTSFRWRRRAPGVRRAWAASLATTVGLSSLVWGPPMLVVGLLFAAGGLLVALALTWALRTALAP
jgi:hypothetical protein